MHDILQLRSVFLAELSGFHAIINVFRRFCEPIRRYTVKKCGGKMSKIALFLFYVIGTQTTFRHLLCIFCKVRLMFIDIVQQLLRK